MKADTNPKISKAIAANIVKIDTYIPNASSSQTKAKMESVKRLYENRNIRNIRTALTLVTMLETPSSDLKDIKKFNALASKYDESLMFKTYRLNKPKHRRYRANEIRATSKIQDFLRKAILFDVVKKESAMDDNLVDILVKPQRVGSIAATDLKRAVSEALIQVLKKIPDKAKFEFYSDVTFTRRTTGKVYLPLVSSTYKSYNTWAWVDHVTKQIMDAIQSSMDIGIKDLTILFHFFMQPSGGASGHGTQSRALESILSKKSVNRIVNDDNNCFWYALIIAINNTDKALKDSRNTRLRERVGRELCNRCKLPWDEEVSFLNIPLVEETLNCNIYVLDLENPNILGSKMNIWNTLLYKSTTRTNASKYLLLFGGNHYHTVNNIEAYLAVRPLCVNCFSCFNRKECYENHICSQHKERTVKRKAGKNSTTNKDLAHYLKKTGFCKGSREELLAKIEGIEDMECVKDISYAHSHPRYIIFDVETDTSTLTHMPNHVEVDILQIDEARAHDYEECLISTVVYRLRL